MSNILQNARRAAVQEQSQSAQWQQEAGRYIPSPEKWLRSLRPHPVKVWLRSPTISGR